MSIVSKNEELNLKSDNFKTMMNSSKRILILHKEKLYHLLSFVLNDNKDGSLYIFLPKKNISAEYWSFSVDDLDNSKAKKEVKPEKAKKITYHTTGRVNITSCGEETTIFCEPLPLISQRNWIGLYSIPDVTKLNLVTGGDRTDFIWSLDVNKRYSFDFALYPVGYDVPGEYVRVSYANLFDLIIRVGLLGFSIPEKNNNHIIFGRPDKGLFDTQQLRQQDKAISLFHQKLHNADNQMLLYPPNPNGVYRVITPDPMRKKPKLQVEFENEDYVAEQLAVKEIHENTIIEFKIKSKGGYLKDNFPVIKSIRLDTRLL